LRAAVVRYASVGLGFLGPEIHGRGTDGSCGSGYPDRRTAFSPLTSRFKLPTAAWSRALTNSHHFRP
jgi:hypothetical protein